MKSGNGCGSGPRNRGGSCIRAHAAWPFLSATTGRRSSPLRRGLAHLVDLELDDVVRAREPLGSCQPPASLQRREANQRTGTRDSLEAVVVADPPAAPGLREEVAKLGVQGRIEARERRFDGRFDAGLSAGDLGSAGRGVVQQPAQHAQRDLGALQQGRVGQVVAEDADAFRAQPLVEDVGQSWRFLAETVHGRGTDRALEARGHGAIVGRQRSPEPGRVPHRLRRAPAEQRDDPFGVPAEVLLTEQAEQGDRGERHGAVAHVQERALRGEREDLVEVIRELGVPERGPLDREELCEAGAYPGPLHPLPRVHRGLPAGGIEVLLGHPVARAEAGGQAAHQPQDPPRRWGRLGLRPTAGRNHPLVDPPVDAEPLAPLEGGAELAERRGPARAHAVEHVPAQR